MPTLAAVMDTLKCKGSEKTRATYIRHGSPTDSSFGVSIADLKLIAKSLKREQGLALDLYATGIVDAMYLAGLIADGKLMTREQLRSWAENSRGVAMISDYTVPWVTVENPEARSLALAWIASEEEHIAAAGWSTYSGIVTITNDEALDLTEIQALLKTVATTIHKAPNHVRSAMNRFVIAVGAYVTPLAERARATARQIGQVSIDVGDTACQVPDALEYISRIEARGSAGVKRKTIRC